MPTLFPYTTLFRSPARFGEPNEVAESVVWLVSDRSSFVTGTALSVDAGAMAQ